MTPAPTTLGARCSTRPTSYKVSVYDAPIYIADAAVVLMKTKPDLGIKNPYALDDDQFAAAVDLLKQQKPAITQYWVRLHQADRRLRAAATRTSGRPGSHQQTSSKAEKPPVKVDVIKPPEGATGWSDTWMINSKTKNLACAYACIDYLVSPETNAEIAVLRRGAGQLEGLRRADQRDPNHCTIFHANDDAFWQGRLVLADPDGRLCRRPQDVKCKDFDDWIKAWTEVKG